MLVEVVDAKLDLWLEDLVILRTVKPIQLHCEVAINYSMSWEDLEKLAAPFHLRHRHR